MSVNEQKQTGPDVEGEEAQESARQRPATDFLQLARDAHSTSITWFDSSVRDRITADIRQWQSKHPEGSKYQSDAYRARSKFFRPKTRAAVRKSEAVAAAAFFASGDVISIEATNTRNPVHVAGAQFVQALVQNRLTTPPEDGGIPWFLTLMGAYQDAQVTSVCISHQDWEYDKAKGLDRPRVDLVPVENFRVDPASDWSDPVGSSPYVIHEIPMYVKDVRAKMRNGEWTELSDAQIQTAVKPWDSVRQQREDHRPDSKEPNSSINAFSIVWVHRNIIEGDDGQDMLFYTLGTEHLLSEPIPMKARYWHGRRPYVMGVCVLEAHKIYPQSKVGLLGNMQSEVNDLANLRMDNIKFVLNKRYFVRRNRQVDVRSLTRNIPGSATLMNDPDADVKVVDFNDVTGSAYQEQDRLNLDFDDVAGTFSGSSVASNRKLNETVGGMNILTSGANQVDEYQLRTFAETWVEPVLRQLMLLEQYHETDQEILMLAAQEAEYPGPITDEFLLQPMSLTVNVGMGATNPQNMVEKFVFALRSVIELFGPGVMTQLNREAIASEMFAKLGYKNAARFIEFGNDQQPLLDRIAELEQALNAKFPPELIDAQVKEIMARIKKLDAESESTGVESQYSALQAGQVLASVPGVAPLADAIMVNAGHQDPNPAGVDPNFPSPSAPGVAMQPQANTNPLTPANPDVGLNSGIETPEADGVRQ